VAILLGLLHLGVKNIHIGPKAPEWFTSNIVEVLQKSFDLQLISGDPKADLEKFLG
jgi:hydroxylamine reductase